MFKSKTTRVVAFIGTLGASAALIGTAASSTGAYFTDTEQGSLSGTAGHLKLNKIGDYDLKYDHLMPGQYQDQKVRYSTDSNGAEDIWLHFKPSQGYDKLTADKATNGGGLGGYGHFAVKNNDGGTLFSSYNLQNESKGVSGCADDKGHGSNKPATGPNNATDTDGYCGIPEYILVESNVPTGSHKEFTMTFGLTGKASGADGQDAQWANAPFEVVATQPGVRPDAKNF